MNEMTAGEAADELEELKNGHIVENDPFYNKLIGYAASILRRVVSGELAEVVHCGECKYFLLHPSREFTAEGGMCTNYLHVGGVKVKSDFCSYGEGKDDKK
jgi:hypothetical protein